MLTNIDKTLSETPLCKDDMNQSKPSNKLIIITGNWIYLIDGCELLNSIRYAIKSI